jgi:hypothetical protein
MVLDTGVHSDTPLGAGGDDSPLDQLTAALDRAGAWGPGAFADPDSVVALHQLQSRLEALVSASVAAFDAEGGWVDSGARGASAWLSARCRLSPTEARRQVRRGRALRHLPATERAFAAGAITGAHVDVVAGLRAPATEEALARDESLLVDQATGLRFSQFARTTGYWLQLADPDGTEEAAEARRARRDVSLAESIGGHWFGTLHLDPVSGSVVGNELDRLEHLLFEDEWAEARERLGREPTTTDLVRTPGQRRADALVAMATRSGTAPEGGRRPRPLFTVLVGYETLHGRICQLEGGTVVPPGSLVPWLAGAEVERAEPTASGALAVGARATLAGPTTTAFDRAVFGPVVRRECSPAERLFTGATRRAIEVRDQRCTHPTCDLPAPRCQVDHIVPWSEGGPTTQANGRLLCGPHNRMRNQRPPPGG